MVEICEEWNSLSVKRHSRQVLPTPESPISSSRNSTSYCFAMAGTRRGPGGCEQLRAQPRSASAIAAGARPRTPRRRGGSGPGPRLASPARPLACWRGEARLRRERGAGKARAGERWEGTAAAAAPARPSAAAGEGEGSGEDPAAGRGGVRLGFRALGYRVGDE